MYLFVKAIHIFAVVLLIGGMLSMALALRTMVALPNDLSARRFGETVLRWDGFVTTPALAVVWMAGFTMAFGAGWDSAPWLLVKLIPASFLTVLHSIEGWELKKLLRGGHPTALARIAPPAILLAFAAIDWLVVTKPF